MHLCLSLQLLLISQKCQQPLSFSYALPLQDLVDGFRKPSFQDAERSASDTLYASITEAM